MTRMCVMIAAACVACAGLMPMPCRAALHVSLPTQGYYRPGRYLPIALTADAPATATAAAPQVITITAEGAATTVARVRLSDRPCIVPLLVAGGTLSHLTAITADERVEFAAPLIPLEAGTQLIATEIDTSPTPISSAIAGGGARVVVRTNLSQLFAAGLPTLQPIDVILPDAPLSPAAVMALRNGGTECAASSNARVSNTGAAAVRGPLGCDGGAEAYAPTHAWNPDWSIQLRVQVVLLGILSALSALACTLVNGRWRIGLLAIMCGGFAVGIAAWRNRSSSVFEIGGTVVVRSAGQEQRDRWRYFTAREAQTIHVNGTALDDAGVESVTWPIFVDSLQLLQSHATLHFPDGGWSWTLPANARAAFVTRSIRGTDADSATQSPPASPLSSPLTQLIRSVYRSPASAVEVVPAVPGPAVWPTIELHVDERAPR